MSNKSAEIIELLSALVVLFKSSVLVKRCIKLKMP